VKDCGVQREDATCTITSEDDPAGIKTNRWGKVRLCRPMRKIVWPESEPLGLQH